MGISVTANAILNGSSNEAYESLANEIAKHELRLFRLDLRRKSGKFGYRSIGLAIDIVPPSIDNKPFSAEEIAAKAIEICQSHSDKEGAAYYQLAGYADVPTPKGKAGGGRPPELFAMVLHFGEGGVDDDDAPGVDQVRVLNVLRGQIKDHHEREMHLLDAQLKLVDVTLENIQKIAEAATKTNQTVIELANIQANLERDTWQKKQDMEEQRENAATIRSVIDQMGRPFAERFSSVFGDFFEQKLGMTKGPFATRLRTLLDGLSTEQLKQFAAAVGDDNWDALQACCKATSDEQFRAIFDRVIGKWKQDKDSANRQLVAVSQILGVKMAGFVALLQELGIQDEG